MATFSKKTFDAASYLKFRPTYSPRLVQHVMEYAKPPKGATALDVGCGPGQATTLLAASGAFRKVVGVDPSEKMIQAANTTLESDPASLLESGTSFTCEVSYRLGNAEDLSWVEEASVDLVTAGQAAHWFDHCRVYDELSRILKPGGTVAYWGYSYLFLPDYPETTPKIMRFGLETLGDYWEPGRKATESLLDLIPFPEGSVWEATSFRRVKFDLIDSGAYTRSQDVPFPPTSHHPTVMEKMMDLDDLAKQFGTWSSVHNYDQKHKGTRSIVEALMGELKEDLPRHTPFKCVWPLGLMVMKKKQ